MPEHTKLSQCRCPDNNGTCSCGWKGKGINKHVEEENAKENDDDD